MPYFRFLIHGKGKIAEGIEGFYTTRWSWDSDQDAAGTKVLKRVAEEWKTGEYAPMCHGNPPVLEIEEGRQIGVLELRDAPNKGYTFYGDK